MHFRSALLALAASTGYASALSTSCTTKVASFALGDLGTCLQLTSLLSVISSSGSITSSLNTYLSTLCASSTTTCSNSTLTSAISGLNSSCSSDISSGGSAAVEVEGLLVLLQNYPQVIAAGCSKNTTTSDYCLIDALNTVQNATGTNITLSSLTSILAGGSSSLSSIESAVTSGALCTQCNSGIYYEVLQANSSLSSSTLGKSLTSQCGSSFGTTAPNSTVNVASSSSSAATSSSATTSSKSSSAGQLNSSPYASLLSTAMLAGAMIGAVALGAVTVL